LSSPGGPASLPPSGHHQAQQTDRHGEGRHCHRRPPDRRVTGVGAGVQRVHRAGHAQDKTGHVHASPEAPGDAAHQQGAHVDGEQHVQRHDSPRDRAWFPGRSQGHEKLRQAEVNIGVKGQTGQVGTGEGDRQQTEEAVQIQIPGGWRDFSGQPPRDDQTPHDRRRDQRPGNQPARPGQVPPELMVYGNVHTCRLVILVCCPC
jgi:hypothetical protein